MRHVLEALNENGYVIDTLHVTGGHTRNPLLMELYADATGCTVVEPLADEAVLAGTGMVAATAAGLYPDLNAACVDIRVNSAIEIPFTFTAKLSGRSRAPLHTGHSVPDM